MMGVGAGGPGAGDASLIGATIEAFEVLSLIGRGGMGEVYKAQDVRLGRTVALKIVSDVYARDEEFAKRFEREARAASALNHPNVAQVYWAGRHQGRPYFAMEFVDGSSLQELLGNQGRIAGTAGLSYMAQACEGLHAAQQQGVIHRDIKPANLMIDSTGRLKIVDFGLARRVAGDVSLTRTDFILGTPRYMSPEQAVAGEVDFRSDIYSLGASFYHLFAGEPPFEAPTPLALLMKHVNDPLPSLKGRNPRVPLHVCTIVHRMLAKRPEDRYQSYDELLEDIRAAQAGRLSGNDTDFAATLGRATAVRVEVPEERRVSLSVWVVGFALAVLALVGAGLFLQRRDTGTGAAATAPAQTTPRGVAASASASEPPSTSVEGQSPREPATEPATETGEGRAWPGRAAPDESAREPVGLPGGLPPGLPSLPRGSIFDMALRTATMAAMRRLATVMEMHRAERDELPTSLSEVEQYLDAPEDRLDGWKREMRYERLDRAKYRITSAGADGAFGTQDDVVLENSRFVKGGN